MEAVNTCLCQNQDYWEQWDAQNSMGTSLLSPFNIVVFPFLAPQVFANYVLKVHACYFKCLVNKFQNVHFYIVIYSNYIMAVGEYYPVGSVFCSFSPQLVWCSLLVLQLVWEWGAESTASPCPAVPTPTQAHGWTWLLFSMDSPFLSLSLALFSRALKLSALRRDGGSMQRKSPLDWEANKPKYSVRLQAKESAKHDN